jgi:hypothetical protein
VKKFSSKNSYSSSTGEKYTRTQIEVNIRKAKKEALQKQLDLYGYNFCSVCKRNDCVPVDCSHDIPVSQCLNEAKAELAWDVNNITPTGRKCHQIKDKLI